MFKKKRQTKCHKHDNSESDDQLSINNQYIDIFIYKNSINDNIKHNYIIQLTFDRSKIRRSDEQEEGNGGGGGAGIYPCCLSC